MVDSTPLIPSDKGKKQGHRVLCCCDSRKATVLINFLALLLIVINLIFAGINKTLDTSIVAIVIYCISILFYFIVMCSAIQFHRCAVIVAIIWEVITIVVMIVGLVMNRKEVAEETETDSNRIGLIVILVVYFVVKVFVIYAEGVYVSEVGKGIMSRATHDREKYSW
jgi:lysylphosphatidylglycerol synthetase-like protein (DUF2156 family)